MQLNYNSTHDEQSYLGRVFLFIKRNYWLYFLDVLIILFLIIPPYSWEETWMLVIMLLILSIRDIIILRLSVLHLGSFVAKGNDVVISILKRSNVHREIKEWLPDLELEIKYIFGFPVLNISKENEIIFKQFPVGDWTLKKMKEFVDSFYEYKKEQNLWKIYKGQD